MSPTSRQRSFGFGSLGQTWTLFWVTVLALLASPKPASAEDICEICKKGIAGTVYLLHDDYHNKTHLACKPCSLLTTLCVVCNLPVAAQTGLRLPDGRVYCPEDAGTAVISEDVATTLFAKASEKALDLLSAYPPLPHRNIETHLVTREEFNRQYRRTPGIDDPEKLLGLTLSRQTQEGKFAHDIYLLHGVPQEEFLSVCAHEYTHAWLDERGKKTRQLHKDTEEGFCEFIALDVVGRMGFEREKERILENQYTRGQVKALAAGEKEYGFYRLARWITDGVDSWLDIDKLPRLLILREAPEEPKQEFAWPAQRPTAVPNKLMVKGVFRRGAQTTVLINDTTLSIMAEAAKVRVGTSNVLVQCLSITSNAVVLQVIGELSPRTLPINF